MRRRTFLRVGAGLAALLNRLPEIGCEAVGATAHTAPAIKPMDWTPFSEAALLERAHALSRTPYVSPEIARQCHKALNYDQYRSIHFKKKKRFGLVMGSASR